MFEQAKCKHPFIVLKDIRCDELECLLSYMYVGEVNVVQEKLSGLIKAAECLRIKGLAVPDEEPLSKPSGSRDKRSIDNSIGSEPKRRRQDDGSSSFRQSSNRTEERRKSLDHQSPSNKFRNNSSSSINNSVADNTDIREDRQAPSPLPADRTSEIKSEAFAGDTEAPEEVVSNSLISLLNVIKSFLQTNECLTSSVRALWINI